MLEEQNIANAVIEQVKRDLRMVINEQVDSLVDELLNKALAKLEVRSALNVSGEELGVQINLIIDDKREYKDAQERKDELKGILK